MRYKGLQSIISRIATLFVPGTKRFYRLSYPYYRLFGDFHTFPPLSQQKAVTLQPKTGRKIERIWIIQKQKIR